MTFTDTPAVIAKVAAEWRLCRERHKRQHADSRIMPTSCKNQQLGGARVGFMIGIIRGLPGKLTAYRRADIELA
jgi:hypothetical protein